MLAIAAVLLGSLACGGAQEIRQAGEIVLAVKLQGPRLFVSEHILAEMGAKRGETFGDFRQPLLACGVKPGAGAAEARPVALKYASLLGAQRQAILLPPQRVDTGEQGVIEADAVRMCGEQRRDLPLDGEQVVVAMSASERYGTLTTPGRAGRRCVPVAIDRIIERRRRRIAGDSVDLTIDDRLKRLIERRAEMFGLDGGKRVARRAA